MTYVCFDKNCAHENKKILLPGRRSVEYQTCLAKYLGKILGPSGYAPKFADYHNDMYCWFYDASQNFFVPHYFYNVWIIHGEWCYEVTEERQPDD